MTLPSPNLDDRNFQSIVDEAKILIPRFCPEWTDHNVSDPGVALIELFAWMTDMLLYRVNQVPEKVYITLLDLIGIRLQPPSAAIAPVTFRLSAAQPTDQVIREGTEVSTQQTSTAPPIVFTTERDLTVRVPHLIAAATSSGRGPAMSWVQQDLRLLDESGGEIQMFPSRPAPGDAFYLAFAGDLSNHILALDMSCNVAAGLGLRTASPPIEWQVWHGGARRWAPCELESDTTLGFNQDGWMVLHLPEMTRQDLQGTQGFWLRCQLTPAQAEEGGYRESPLLQRLRVESRGGTVDARHATSIRNELLGHSDGTPGQIFHLSRTPVLARDPERDCLIVEPPTGEPQAWTEVSDFADSRPGDRHFVLDGRDGTLTLGPSLRQPDGGVYSFGAIPPRGSTIRFSHYQHGGGLEGNVMAGTIIVLRSAIPYIAKVENRQPGTGGRDAQSLEDAKLRAPQTMRTRTRAVTADDFEYLAMQVQGVARAKCLAPGAQPGNAGDPKPGEVLVVVLPMVHEVDGRIPPELLTLSAELRAAVMDKLNACRLIGVSVDVQQPRCIWVSVHATVRIPDRSHSALRVQVKEEAEEVLYRYLNPFKGGPDGNGWPFGRDLHMSEVYSRLQSVPGVEFVEEVQLRIREPGTSVGPPTAPAKLTIPPRAIICSGQHEVTVE